MATETESQDAGMMQTMIWLGVAIAAVLVVAYFYI
jgi:hypothetical protein